jgi:hypothetical protein
MVVISVHTLPLRPLRAFATSCFSQKKYIYLNVFPYAFPPNIIYIQVHFRYTALRHVFCRLLISEACGIWNYLKHATISDV